jgi:tetratricopeptide (TPR) repeat protein
MSRIRTTLVAGLCGLACVLMLAAAAPVAAQQARAAQADPHRPTKTRTVPQALLTERTHRDLERIYAQISDEKYAEALPALNNLLNRSGLTDYEKAVIIQARGYVYSLTDRFDQALRDFEEVVRMNVLPNTAHFPLLLQIANLYMAQERFELTLRWVDEWFAYADTPTADAYMLRATALAQLNRFREALVPIDRALALRPDAPDQWYQLKLAAHFELKEYPQAARVLEYLIQRDPGRRSYWNQLVSVYLAMDDQRNALAVAALAHRKGIFERETEWVQLYQLYSFNEVPYKAAQILEEGLTKGVVEATQRRWEDLGNAWYSAQEMDRALAAYTRAGALSADGKIDLQRGYILVDQEKWAEAEAALSEAVRKGGLDQPCNAHLLLGMAQYEQGKRAPAQASFNRAMQGDRCRRAAEQWLRHMQETRPRAAEPAEVEEQIGPE